MVVKLLVTQIPTFWEAIKFCDAKVNRIDERYMQAHFNKLLHKLLSDKAQCFVRLNTDRTLISLMVTELQFDEIVGKGNLFIHCLYSFESVPDTEWEEDLKIIKRFANNLKCSSITFDTYNERISRLGLLIGFEETYKSFTMNLEGV